MRVRGRAAAGVLAAGMALTLVAAESAPATPQGTASTSLFGADIQVTNMPAINGLPAVGDISARLMELTSFASTVDTPFAQSAIVPLTLPDGSTPGAVEARSDGNTSGNSALAELGDPLGALGLSVSPVGTTAQAGANSAIASIEAAVAELAALGEALGVDITTPEITSIVDADGAAATQGIRVSDLGLDLAALGLVSDILAQLGVDQVLALLNGFGFDDVTLDEVTDVLDTVASLQNSVAGQMGQLDALETSINASLTELASLNTLMGQLNTLGLGSVLSLVNGSLFTTLNSTLDCGLTALVSTVGDAIACVQAAVTAEAGDLNSDLLGVQGIVNQLNTLVGSLGVELDSLDGLLDTILGLLDELAGSTLLGVSAFDVGVVAIATDTLEGSSATVLCDEVDVTILGQTLTTPGCADGLSAVSDVAGQVTGAVTGVTTLLGSALPIDGLSGLRFDVFANLVQDVSEADGVVTATAGLDLLDMEIPSLTLDPSLVTDLLDGLGLVDVLGPLQDLVSQVQSSLGGLTAITGQLGTVTSTVTSLANAVDDTGTLAGLVGTVEGLLDGILALDFGTLSAALTTPGITLTIDPTSQASFQAGATATPGAPDSDDGQDLPSTGGGLALLGLVAISGAAAMRRRRN